MVLHLCVCRGASTHPRWSNGSHHTCETRCVWLWLYFSICENKCCRSTNSVAWTFDSGRTIRVENVFPFVVFISSQLISLCLGVTDTLVTSRVTDIPRVFWETHDTVQAHTPAYLVPAVLISQTVGSTKYPAHCYLLYCSWREKKNPARHHLPPPKNKPKTKLKIIIINLTVHVMRSKFVFLEGSVIKASLILAISSREQKQSQRE